MQFSRSTCVAFLALLLTPAPSLLSAEPSVARAQGGMVVADERHAVEAGIEILRRGGNAVDAAVAVAFALAVTHPGAGNIGGGGFLLVRMANGGTFFIDYREVAPLAARRDMYLDAQGNFVPERSTLGWLAAGVPGTVAGMELALRALGTMSLPEVMEPAIRLAENGFPLSERLAEDFRRAAKRLERFPESRKIFLRKGRFYTPGEIFRQKNLAKTLKKIARGGAQEFYEGSIAKRLAKENRAQGGLFTLEDLRRYRARLREPLRGSFRDYEILTAPPPSSGGVALLEMLNILDPLLPPDARLDDAGTVHLIVEVMRRAFADRARFLGDPDFARIPVDALLDPRYAAAHRATIDFARATPSAHLPLPDPAPYEATPAVAGGRESEETTHFSVVDAVGNAVANTYTINDFFGNGVTVPGLGFLLNNEMDDFAAKPGAANASAELVQGEANRIEPRKRPLSSMTPTIVVRDAQPVLVLGAPGGPTIINSVLLTLLNRLVFGLDLPQAVQRARYHHQWMPDKLVLERTGFDEGLARTLEARGHTIEWRERGFGALNAIEIAPATRELTGVGDARRGAVALGLERVPVSGAPTAAASTGTNR